MKRANQLGAKAAIHVNSDMNNVKRVGKRKGEIKSEANCEDQAGRTTLTWQTLGPC